MQIHENVPLAPYTSYRIGGPARYFVIVSTLDELRTALAEAERLGSEPFFLAGGTNLLVPDEGLNRFVIKLELRGMKFSTSGSTRPVFHSPSPAYRQAGTQVIHSESVAGRVKEDTQPTVKVFGGTSLQELVDAATTRSLGGLEWAGGLPGSVGGAIRGNAGAFGGEIRDVVSSVETIDTEGQQHTYSTHEVAFGYRDSRFKHSGEAVVSAILTLHPANQARLAALVADHRAHRQRRHPLEHPNAGSVFKNVRLDSLPPELQETWRDRIKTDPFPVVPTAVIIAAAGLAGHTVGGAQVSTKHTNYIVNLGSATAADVRQVIADVQQAVHEQFGIHLEPEILIL